MKPIYIPLNDYKAIGGPTTFLKNLEKYFIDNKVPYTKSDHKESGSILFPIQYSRKTLKQYKDTNRPIIQRLDGLGGFPWHRYHGLKGMLLKAKYENNFYKFKTQVKFILEMIQIDRVVKKDADHIIFQSHYCKKLCEYMLGKDFSNKSTIIHNGVHGDIFYPSENEKLSKKPVFITTGRFRRKDMLLPILEAMDYINKESECTLKIIGPIELPLLEREVLKREYVQYLGPKDLSNLSSELRNSDIYLFSSLNAPCPNALLEAVSSGLPVVSYDYGSVRELLFFNKELIAPVSTNSHPIIKTGKDLSAEALIEKIRECLKNFLVYKKRAMNFSTHYSFEKCGEKYVEVIKKLSAS